MKIPIPIFFWAILAGCGSPPKSTVSATGHKKNLNSFFTKYCLECHGIEAEEAGLDLRSYESILAGGDSGPAIVPGNSDESLLLKMIRNEEMPPEGDLPTAEEIALVTRWIQLGALP